MTKRDAIMMRPITLFTGQWADIPLEKLAEMVGRWGFDGLELACWGDHFDPRTILRDGDARTQLRSTLDRHSLQVWAVSNHLTGQAVCDVPIDHRHQAIVPAHVWGDGDPEGVRRRAAEEMKDTARAAAAVGVTQVNGFTGSSVWHMLAGFPPVSEETIERGYEDFVERWTPILEVFEAEGVRFGLEIHPAEIAYDFWTTKRTLEAMPTRAFGINFDPSHLHWQQVDPAAFIGEFANRIYHVHCKDTSRQLDGRNGIIASHLPFGDHRRGWDFRSVGRGGIDFEAISRALNRIGYTGPLSVEWEDVGLDREIAAQESLEFVRRTFRSSWGRQFDAAFSTDDQSDQPRVATGGAQPPSTQAGPLR